MKLRADYPEAWNNRCNALLNLEQYAEALVASNRAIELKPDYQATMSNRAQVKAIQNAKL